MAVVSVKLNLEKLKNYDLFFQIKWLNTQKTNEWAERKLDPTNYEILLDLGYRDEDYHYIKRLVKDFPLINGKEFDYDELLAWAYVTKININEAVARLQYANRRTLKPLK